MGIFDAALGVPPPPPTAGKPKGKIATVTTHRKRQTHTSKGDPCGLCGQPACEHVAPKSKRLGKYAKWEKPTKGKRKRRKQPKDTRDISLPFLGVDGEGKGRNPHLYTLLAAVDEDGSRYHVEDCEGLTTVQCFEFLLTLPEDRYIFGYALGYDWTKILQDVDDGVIYALFRPDMRVSRFSRFHGPRGVKWGQYTLNMQGTKFVLQKGERTVVIWDIFKFFQGKFVSAITDWKVGNKDLWRRMTVMKNQRGEFEHVSADKVRDYCFEECQCMAQLARKLYDAHIETGLELQSFYGAGSSASAMLTKMGIKEYMSEPPDEMADAVGAAFFGGRFENSVIGEVDGPVYNHDISSAYPYQLYFLPCLAHATWSHTTRREELEGKSQALVRFRLAPNPVIEHWAPFPHRDLDGNISYPSSMPNGWVWLAEYLAGEAGFPANVEFLEAWIMHTNCVCRPFKDIAHYYSERCRIGKEGPGIVLKLGCNSCYGKIAQSVGSGKFNNWAWAGMITSGCRAQLLNMICSHQDRSKCLMVATDGVFTSEELIIPTPLHTGTETTGKPLGGWESKTIKQSVFIARPGIYFPMDPSKDQLKEVKGRGVGKGIVFDNWKLISDSWHKHRAAQPVEVANVVRFCGAKTSISLRERGDEYEFHRADGTSRPEDPPDYQPPFYGEWIARKVSMSFDPMPKRSHILPDGRSLALRSQHSDSCSYKKAGAEQEIVELHAAIEELLEQPDADFDEIQ